jgi:polar amino acid transport system substrate-binding protein
MTSPRSRAPLAPRIVAALATSLACAAWLPASAATLDRIQETGHIRLGYLDDVRPFSYRNEAGSPDGYSVALCQQVAERVKVQLNLPQLAVDWVQVPFENRLSQVQQGTIDLLCAPLSETVARRQQVSFSIPVFPGGVRAVLRADAPKALKNALSEHPASRPVWRGSPAAKLLEKKTFAVVAGSTTEPWLAGRILMFQIDARTVKVPDYRTGLQQLLDGKADVFFGDRALILGALDDSSRQKVEILDRLLTYEPLKLPLARGDEDFRLLVDRTLSEMYTSGRIADLYAKWGGTFDDKTRTFFMWTTLAQ